ncbi:dipeptide/oligopeptide/nickel ABC transporter permease/ATP-binding protein [Leucobacter allii]|uniref:dipeptide/oligopeptide/nickel ABC transporter permease/ATP-binding protein n=1 Tax=Leucobacter allii TaxID=2932247 RepID=UPI001FD50E4C|nr:dipeptide/oligopeptide/nickel ABC transporter permease/ATP-binding protein [Leucobacter allii]UOR02377.1 dipeptide/oligopeptide/nickel ABC transporter permease/ATP-binding protein [Leucobacter allii]
MSGSQDPTPITRSVTPPSTTTIALQSAKPTKTGLGKFFRNPRILSSLIIVGIAVLVAILSPWIAPYGAEEFSLSDSLATPSPEHLLGADRAGRDLLSRLILATPMSLMGSVVTLGTALVIGLPFGLIAGYRGGTTSRIGAWVSSLIMAMPAIVFLLTVRAVVGPSIWVSMVVFGLIISPQIFRVVESAVADVRHELYIDAAKVSGLSDSRIIRRHVLRIIAAPIMIQAAFIGGASIAMQASLEFLGIGDPNTPTWGGMLNSAFGEIFRAPWQVIWPALAIGLISGALIMIATAISDLTRPRGMVGAAGKTNLGFSAETAAAEGGNSEAKSPALLRIRDLAVGYPSSDGIREVVQGVSLSLQPGEVLGLVGESGSGKTQIALSVLGLLPASAKITRGEIEVDGTPLAQMSVRERRRLLGSTIGYVPQEPMTNLDPAFRVGEQIARPLRLHLKLSRKAARERALELLEQVGIRDVPRVFNSYPHQISGGIAQRVLIAGAVSLEPRLLVADEPTTALDVTIQAEVLGVLRRLQAERGMSMLVVTHNFGVVADICDRVTVMSNGRIVEEGAVREVLGAPQHPYTQNLLGSMLDKREPLIASERNAK